MVPGTNAKTNRNAYEMIRHDTIFTNVAVTADNQPWWEGLPEGKPALDWQGRPYDPANGAGRASEFALHGGRATESRATRSSPTRRAACRSRRIVFGGRRRSLAPLVYQARSWLHGVLVGRAARLGDDRRGHRARSASCAAIRWR